MSADATLRSKNRIHRSARALENEQRNLVLADLENQFCAGACRKYAIRPPTSENSDPANSGRLNVNGIRPWNHGFTV
jgi:hypothetical protein